MFRSFLFQNGGWLGWGREAENTSNNNDGDQGRLTMSYIVYFNLKFYSFLNLIPLCSPLYFSSHFPFPCYSFYWFYVSLCYGYLILLVISFLFMLILFPCVCFHSSYSSPVFCTIEMKMIELSWYLVTLLVNIFP